MGFICCRALAHPLPPWVRSPATVILFHLLLRPKTRQLRPILHFISAGFLLPEDGGPGEWRWLPIEILREVETRKGGLCWIPSREFAEYVGKADSIPTVMDQQSSPARGRGLKHCLGIEVQDTTSVGLDHALHVTMHGFGGIQTLADRLGHGLRTEDGIAAGKDPFHAGLQGDWINHIGTP